MDKKTQILSSAFQTFSTFGYRATTIDHIAKSAKVGKGTVYNFFASKEELFNEVITHIIYEIKEIAENNIDYNKPLYENLHNVLFFILDYRNKHKLTIQLLQESEHIGTKETIVAIERIEKAIILFLKKEIDKAIEKNEVENVDSELTAFIVFKLYISLIVDWEKQNKPLDKEQISKIFKHYVYKAISA